MTTPAIQQLADFFTATGLRWKVYDLSPGLRLVPAETFRAFDAGRLPWPHPYLGRAQFALVLWREGEARQPMLWFLRFSLDEQGKLAPALRDQFLAQLLTTLGENLDAAKRGEALKGVLDNNPFVWEPDDSLKAACHAKLSYRLKLPPSQHFDEARHYLLQGPWDYWQALGLQGLADLVVRWSEAQIGKALNQALPALPVPVVASLCPLLEHEALDASLSQTLARMLANAHQEGDRAQINGLLRALASSEATGLVQAALEQLLQSPALDTETLVTLATRHGRRISQPELTGPYLEQLAQLDQAAFNRIMAELLYQPALRPAWLAAFRDPQRSDTLARAIGGLLNPS